MIQPLVVGFAFSFLGSIPPGTINLCVLQLGLQNQMRGVLFFSLAATAVEFIYASLAVEFQMFLSQSTSITDNFQIITALAMIALGAINLSRGSKHKKVQVGQGRRSFRNGVIISAVNPLAIPFWVAVTAYLQNHHLVTLNTSASFWSYIVGICLGTLILLLMVGQMAQRFQHFQGNLLVNKLPGLIFVGMGVYTFWS